MRRSRSPQVFLVILNFLGPYLYLGYPELDDFSSWLVLTVIPLAIVTGWAGSGMAMMILAILKKNRGVMYIVGCGLAIAALVCSWIPRRWDLGRKSWLRHCSLTISTWNGTCLY